MPVGWWWVTWGPLWLCSRCSGEWPLGATLTNGGDCRRLVGASYKTSALSEISERFFFNVAMFDELLCAFSICY